jgi:hypothetical protein
MKVVKVHRYEEGWDEFALRNEGGSIYHLYSWRDIFSRCFGYRSYYIKAVDQSGVIRGIQPLFLVRIPLQKKLVSVPFRDRGGPIWEHRDALCAILKEVKVLASELGASYAEIKSLSPFPKDIVDQAGLVEEEYWVRSVVGIAFTSDELWKAIGPKTRNMVRQAERESLVFEEDVGFQDPASEFYAIFLDTQKKLGVPPFPKLFFSMMYDRLRRSDHIRLFFATKGGRPVAATILFLFGDMAVYAYSASLRDALAARVNDFMMWNILCWLIERGYRTFDLGSDSPLQDGLLFFKRKWLATQRPIPFYYYFPRDREPPRQVDSSLQVYAVYRRIFSMLPGPVFRSLGGYVTRYLG